MNWPLWKGSISGVAMGTARACERHSAGSVCPTELRTETGIVMVASPHRDVLGDRRQEIAAGLPLLRTIGAGALIGFGWLTVATSGWTDMVAASCTDLARDDAFTLTLGNA